MKILQTLDRLIGDEREEQAEILAGLTADRWDEPSLCRGWSVRHVVAHQAMMIRYSPQRLALEMVRARFRFHGMTDRVARRDASLPTSDLLAALRADPRRSWARRALRADATLAHDVVHGLDVTEALGIDRCVPSDRILPVLDRSYGLHRRRHFGVDLQGLELRATDVAWSAGAGLTLQGRGQDLVLLLTGRPVEHERIAGVRHLGEVTDDLT